VLPADESNTPAQSASPEQLSDPAATNRPLRGNYVTTPQREGTVPPGPARAAVGQAAQESRLSSNWKICGWLSPSMVE
jgi:hypothetical protein